MMNSELEIALYLTDDATEVQIDLWFLWHLLPDNYPLRFNADIITLPDPLGWAWRSARSDCMTNRLRGR
jgi:hypothetical protein